MNEMIEQLDVLYQKFISDVRLCAIKGNKAAEVRSRKSSLELTKLMKTWRAESVKE